MTKKILNIIITILVVFIVVYFSIKMVYDGLLMDKADKDMNNNPIGGRAAIHYVID